MRHSIFGLLFLITCGCAESHDPRDLLPEVPPDARLGELSAEQFREYCEWHLTLSDGEEYIACADGRMYGRFDLEACSEQHAFYVPACPATLEDAVACQEALLAACEAGEELTESPASCVRASPCWELVD